MSRNFISRMVPLSPNSGTDINAYLVLNQETSRQEQKLKTLCKYVAKYDSGWKKRLELANLYYEMGRWSEATKEYQQVILRQPHLLKPRLQLGKILQLLALTEQAIAVYQDALTVAKQQSTKKHLAGLINSCQNDLPRAIAAFESATTLEPDNLAHWLALGQVQMMAEQLAIALGTFEQILLIDPGNVMALIYRYDLLIGLNNHAAAAACLQKLRQIAPEDVQTLKRLIAARCSQGLVSQTPGKQTKKLITALLKQASSSAEAHNLQAQYYILRGEPSRGIQILEQFTQVYPRNPQGWYYYSQCLLAQAQEEPAATAISIAYQLSQSDREIYRATVETLSATGKLEQARYLIDEMLERFPQAWSLWTSAGKILVQYFQECELGCSYSCHGTQLQPELAEVWLRHSRVLSLAGRSKAAIAAFNHARKLQPQITSNTLFSI